MNKFKEKMRLKIERFLAGRNGMDELARDVYFLSIVVFVIGIISRSGVAYALAMAGLGYSAFRVYSKNIYARRTENLKYLAFRGNMMW